VNSPLYFAGGMAARAWGSMGLFVEGRAASEFGGGSGSGKSNAATPRPMPRPTISAIDCRISRVIIVLSPSLPNNLWLVIPFYVVAIPLQENRVITVSVAAKSPGPLNAIADVLGVTARRLIE